MIGFALHHGLAYYYLKTNQTKDVLPTIEKVSKYGSCAIYIALAIVFWKYTILCISIFSVAIFETLALSMLPIPKTWPAFELVRIEADNEGWDIDESGYIWKRKKEKVDDEPQQSQVSTT